MKQVFFFTYGTSKSQPFSGGWTQISADSYEDACDVHARIFGLTGDGLGRFCSAYTEAMWAKTDMGSKGNLGAFCQMVL